MSNQLKENLILLLDKYETIGGAMTKRDALRDLLTDVIHHCESKGIEFDEICRDAKEVYNEEITWK